MDPRDASASKKINMMMITDDEGDGHDDDDGDRYHDSDGCN